MLSAHFHPLLRLRMSGAIPICLLSCLQGGNSDHFAFNFFLYFD